MKLKYKNIQGMLKDDRCAWIIGSGTSLKGFNFHNLDKEFTIALNHSIEFYPQASCLLFGDKVFLKHTSFDLKSYPGLIFATEHVRDIPAMYGLRSKPNVYFFETRRGEVTLNAKIGLFHPTSAGMLAINLALQMVARKIFLLGFDYYYQNIGSAQKDTHFFGNIYPHHLEYPEERVLKKVDKFKYFERWKKKIINLNPKSAIITFQKQDWHDIFKEGAT